MKVRGVLALLICSLTVGVLLGPVSAQGTRSMLFVDVPADHWASADLQYLVERGIITGLPNGEFRGDQALTRYSAAAMVARAIRFLQNNPSQITTEDVEVLQELIFNVADKLEQMDQELNKVKAAHGDSELVTNLQERVNQNAQAIGTLQGQLKSQGTGVGSRELETIRNQADASFIIAIASLFVGIIGIALATM